VIRGFKELRLLMTDKDSVKAMKCFDIDWCGSYEVTSNGSAKQRLCTLKTSYRDKY